MYSMQCNEMHRYYCYCMQAFDNYAVHCSCEDIILPCLYPLISHIVSPLSCISMVHRQGTKRQANKTIAQGPQLKVGPGT